MPVETDEQRKARTDLSSLEMSDKESAAVQKTPNRVTLDSMLAKIVDTEFINPASIPHMTICVLTMKNGFAVVGKSAPADAGNYDRDLGHKFAKEDAVRQLWAFEGYALREQMSNGGGD
jgi:hypothetical protein